MSLPTSPSEPQPMERVPTGIEGLDTVLQGGLFRGGVYMVVGRPGAGKTIFANQICFHQARRGHNVLYVTLLTETHGRLLANLRALEFFEERAIGERIYFANGYNAIEAGGLDELLKLLRVTMRERSCSLMVIDGMVTVEALASSKVAYKKFIQELQTWVGFIGCTVLILTSAAEDTLGPEHTMVDGIFELAPTKAGPRMIRKLTVSKFRGSGFIEGSHDYRITGRGIVIYPRLEALLSSRVNHAPPPERVQTGVVGLDPLLHGGLSARSITVVLGSSGAGKTMLGLQFLAEGARRGERGLHFGFFENPETLLEKADRVGLPCRKLREDGLLEIVWQSAAEALLDELGHRLLNAVKDTGAKRLFVDGLVGFKESAVDPNRLGGFMSTLAEELRAHGVTAIFTEESRELYVQEVEIPVPGVSAAFENIIFVRQVESNAELLRLISIMKTRDSAHASRLHRFEITDKGLRVGAPFEHETALLIGDPHEAESPKRKTAPPRSARRSAKKGKR